MEATVKADVLIRQAQPDDLEEVVGMAERFVAETKYSEFISIDPARVSQTAMNIVLNPDGLLLIAEKEGRAVGMIAMLGYEHPFSGKPTAFEVVWWVDPEARGCGMRLLDGAETWARAKGLQAIQMVAPTPEIGALYERLGFQPVETSFQRRL